jgi:hypothetical protein
VGESQKTEKGEKKVVEKIDKNKSPFSSPYQYRECISWSRCSMRNEASEHKNGEKSQLTVCSALVFSAVSVGDSSYLFLWKTTSDCKLSPAAVDCVFLKRKGYKLCSWRLGWRTREVARRSLEGLVDWDTGEISQVTRLSVTRFKLVLLLVIFMSESLWTTSSVALLKFQWQQNLMTSAIKKKCWRMSMKHSTRASRAVVLCLLDRVSRRQSKKNFATS